MPKKKSTRKTAPRAAKAVISVGELRDRLQRSALAPATFRLVISALRHEPESAIALWIDREWDALTKRDFAASRDPCAAVFARPVETSDSIVLTSDRLGGLFGRRDASVFVFLDVVRCRDFCTVPGTLALFLGGLHVHRIASFDASDAHTEVSNVLEAPYVISGVGAAAVYLSRGTKAKIGAYAKHIYGLPKGGRARKHASLAAMLPFVGGDAERMDAWEWAAEFIESGKELPKREDFAKPKKRTSDIMGKTFAFVGKLAFPHGNMQLAKQIVEYNGGSVAAKITDQVDYLVVGDVKSALLGRGPKSVQQKQAEALNARGAAIVIIGEQTFWDMKK